MLILKIIGFVLLAAGAGTVFGAKKIVSKYGLDKKAKCDFENEMSEEEIQQYKFLKASMNIKMLGMVIAIPGIVALLLAFK